MNRMSDWLSNRENAAREFFRSKYAIAWLMVYFFIFTPTSLFAQTAASCPDAALLAQWWAWVGAGWGAGIMLGVFGSNPIGAGLIGTSIVLLEIYGKYGTC